MKTPLVEKYRPKTIDDYIFPTDEVRMMVDKILTSGEIPNLILSGGAGVGKSTLARMLVDICGIDPADILMLTRNEDKNIKAIRELVEGFVSRFAIGDYKVVVIEEADTLTQQAQEGLRIAMEDFYDSSRFILTCNYEGKIISPLKSRCQHIHIKDLALEGMVERLVYIMEQENISYDEETLISHIDAHAPDFRRLLNSVDQFTIDGELHRYDKSVSGSSSDFMKQWINEWEYGSLDNQFLLVELLFDMEDYEAVDAIRVVYENAHRLNSEQRANAYRACARSLADIPVSVIQKINLGGMIVEIFNG